MWDEVFPEFLKRTLGLTPREATRADALALFRAREFDQYFPAGEMERSIRKQVGEMGIDPTANGRVLFDTGEREGKRSRAFCAPVRIPDEVYLVLRPHGGQTDWSTFLHELGHALHFAHMRPTSHGFATWATLWTEATRSLDHLMHYAGAAALHGAGKQTTPTYFAVAASGLHSSSLLREADYEPALRRLGCRGRASRCTSTAHRATTFRYSRAASFVEGPTFYARATARCISGSDHRDAGRALRRDGSKPARWSWIVRSLFGEARASWLGAGGARLGTRCRSHR